MIDITMLKMYISQKGAKICNICQKFDLKIFYSVYMNKAQTDSNGSQAQFYNYWATCIKIFNQIN